MFATSLFWFMVWSWSAIAVVRPLDERQLFGGNTDLPTVKFKYGTWRATSYDKTGDVRTILCISLLRWPATRSTRSRTYDLPRHRQEQDVFWDHSLQRPFPKYKMAAKDIIVFCIPRESLMNTVLSVRSPPGLWTWTQMKVWDSCNSLKRSD